MHIKIKPILTVESRSFQKPQQSLVHIIDLMKNDPLWAAIQHKKSKGNHYNSLSSWKTEASK